MAGKKGEIVKRVASRGGAKARALLEKARKSNLARRGKDLAVRRRSVGVAFIGGMAYEELQQRNIAIPKLPIPLSAEAQQALILALVADKTRGIVQEGALAMSHGLAFTAGRNTRRTGSIGADADDAVII